MTAVDDHNPYFQPVPIDDIVDLTGLGYEDGSQATIILNPKRKVLHDWDATFKPTKNDDGKMRDLTEEEWKECEAVRFRLLPNIITHVVLVKSQGEYNKAIRTEDDARELEDVDGQVIELCLKERVARGALRVLNAARSFQDERSERIKRSRGQRPEVTNANSGSGDASDTPAEQILPNALHTT